MGYYSVKIISPYGCLERSQPNILSNSGRVLPATSVHYATSEEFETGDGWWIRLDTGWYIATRYNGNVKCEIKSLGEEYLFGLSDYQANDPLGNPYATKGNLPRNWTPPKMRPSVPEVRRFIYSGDGLLLTEGIEHMIFYDLWDSNPSWTEQQAKDVYARHMRDDAGFTNKVGWNSSPPRKSWVLNKNLNSKPMMLLGIVCPGGNIFRKTGSSVKKIFNDGQYKPYEAVWNLDYDWLSKNITKSNAREFVKTIPDWLKFYAKIVHPEKLSDTVSMLTPNGVYRVTNWDGNFRLPLISQTGGRVEVVDGFCVRENRLAQNRLSQIRPIF